MRRNPERLAWTVLLISLLICVALAISVPLAVRSFINDTGVTASITLETQVGVLLVVQPGLADSIGVADKQNNIPEGSTIHTYQNTQALLTIRAPQGAVLLTAYIYGSAELKILQAQSPRYSQSVEPHRLSLAINRGQVRVVVAGNGSLDRALEASLVTPQATADLVAGSYSFDVSNTETQLRVWDGQATVRDAHGSSLTLNPAERTRVSPGNPPAKTLSPEQNLVVNGDFSHQPLSSTWDITSTVDPSHPDEPLGTVAITSGVNGNALLFHRTGTNHAETDLTQTITPTGVLTGLRSLKIYFVVQVDSQDVPLCGSQGSECPMMVQLDYQDSAGNSHSYFQGFYTDPDPSGVNPPSCRLCETHNDHIQVPRGVPWPFETGNLMTSLSPGQITITALKFYASGHSYQSSISNIELLAEN